MRLSRSCALTLLVTVVATACDGRMAAPDENQRASTSACGSREGFVAVQASVDVPNEVSGTGYTVVAGPPDGPLVRLTPEHTASSPSISPDGRKIAFDTARNYSWSSDSGSSTTDVYVMDADGSNQKKMITDAWRPDWSPDGKQLLFQRRSGLWVHDVERDEQRSVVKSPAPERGFYADIEDAEWTPGGRIVWLEVRDDEKGLSILKVADSPTSRPRTILERTGRIDSFDWSPLRDEYVYSTSNGWLYLVRPGSVPQLLHEDGYHPFWAPDGESFRFVIGRPYDEDAPQRLVEMDVASRELHAVQVAGRFPGWNLQNADWAACG